MTYTAEYVSFGHRQFLTVDSDQPREVVIEVISTILNVPFVLTVPVLEESPHRVSGE